VWHDFDIVVNALEADRVFMGKVSNISDRTLVNYGTINIIDPIIAISADSIKSHYELFLNIG
jgi:hypothetical protein